MIKFLKLLSITMLISASTYGQSKKQRQQEVYDKIVKANLQHPKIVLQQAIVESGANFKSPAARNKNNILGIMKGKRTRHFSSFDECIEFYKNKVQSRYRGGNYYKFLSRIGYAEDARYIPKLKNTELFILE